MLEQARQARERIRRGLSKHGTDIAHNESDPLGDGDQSVIHCEADRQFYREIFSEGGDIMECFSSGTVSEFASLCVSGEVAKVKSMFEEADRKDQPYPSETLMRLLETRETSMRLSPLLLIVSAGKNLAANDESILRQNQIKVAELLLSFGARPDARDVCGKTVCHYGAGAMATEMTMAVVEMAAKSYETSYMFGKEIELTKLESAEMNGRRGIARGYQNQIGRRAVYLHDDNKQIAVKPENIKLMESTTDASRRKLCDLQCRLGTVSLQETVQGNRGDVAKFLIQTLGARIDIEDLDGCSPKSMAMAAGAEMFSTAVSVIKHAMTKRGRAARKAASRTCANCAKVEPEGANYSVCSQCQLVCYCSRSCQVTHWKAAHKKECKDLAATAEKGVKLQRPSPDGMFTSSINLRTKAATAPDKNGDGYRKPDHVSEDETFYVKVQGGGPQMPLMIYDKTRQCMFHYSPGLPGFDAMREKVNAEPAFDGRKTYMKASFDSNGECTVYPQTSTLKKW